MIKNKKLFKKQMITILITFILVILTNLFFGYIEKNGLSVFFTVNTYKQAFAVISEMDLIMILTFKFIINIFLIGAGYSTLWENKIIDRLEKEEKRIMEVITNDNY